MQESLIEFPAALSVKAMGLNQADFELLVSDTVKATLPADSNCTITTLPSSGGKYLSVSVHFTAADLAQLHAVYAALKAQNRILYLL